MGRETILIVEDEADLREVLRYNLAREGFTIHTARDGAEGLEKARTVKPDLVLLDLMLPDVDGGEVCRRLRAGESTATSRIIMVTAKSAESDVVLGLGLGADDYVTKPFGVKEIIARVKAVLRRGETRDAERAPPVIRRDGIEIDASRHEVLIDGEPEEFTATEFRLLSALAHRPGRVYSREDLLRRVMGDEAFLQERNIDVHIRSIRKKLGAHRDAIETVRGVGYRFRDTAR